jgi:hypothetical protein
MAKRRFGTNAITGLNVGTAPHLIADHELVESIGGWTDEEGAWRTGRDHVTVHSGSAISAMTIGRMGGQDHTVYVDGNGIYDTGSLVGTVAMGTDPRVVAVGGNFLILGASDKKNKIYDGDHVRDQGPWTANSTHPTGIRQLPTATTTSISAITKAAQAVLTVTSSAGFVAGGVINITGVVGMTEINDRSYLVISATTGPDTITIGVDSTNFTTYGSVGTARLAACGYSGDYQYAITSIVQLSSGQVLESKPLNFGDYADAITGEYFEPYTVVATDNMIVAGVFKWAVSSVAEYNITGTIGTDYKPGIRIYRTKADGSDFYLEKQYLHGDSGLTYTTGANANYAFGHNSYLPDKELGALYTAGPYDHGDPPQSSLATQCGQRVFINDVDNPDRVYVSGLDGPEYFNPSDWLVIPDNLTVLRRVRDRTVVGTANRWYLIDMISGFPQVMELDTSTGTIYPDGVSVNDQGLFFVKPEGIFHLDLAKVSKISRRGIKDADLAAGQAALVTADVGIFVCDPQDAGSTAVACIRDGGWIWHSARETLQHTHLAKNSIGQIQGALPTKIETLFLGSDYYGSLTSKTFSDGETWQPIRLLLDVETVGAVTCSYQITTNRGALFTGYQTATLENTTRRIVEFPLTRKPAETFQLQLILDGNAKLYGYAIEVEA